MSSINIFLFPKKIKRNTLIDYICKFGCKNCQAEWMSMQRTQIIIPINFLKQLPRCINISLIQIIFRSTNLTIARVAQQIKPETYMVTGTNIAGKYSIPSSYHGFLVGEHQIQCISSGVGSIASWFCDMLKQTITMNSIQKHFCEHDVL